MALLVQVTISLVLMDKVEMMKMATVSPPSLTSIAMIANRAAATASAASLTWPLLYKKTTLAAEMATRVVKGAKEAKAVCS